jgi:nicotinate-nucleotide adenylyltransferase
VPAARIGILGGTFNPVHLGHLVLAESFRERLALDRVLFVPAGQPPHKAAPDVAPALHRYAMVSLAVAGHPAFAVSSVEIERAGPSYSVDTLEWLAAQWPDAARFLLMGSDTFLELGTWRTPERLTARSTVAVGLRAGDRFEADGPAARAVLARLGGPAWRRVPPTAPATLAPGEVALVEVRSVPVSAREVRACLAGRASVRYLVPLAVAEYIAQHRLYGG